MNSASASGRNSKLAMSETSRLGQNSLAFQSCDLAPVEGRQPSLYFSVPRGFDFDKFALMERLQELSYQT
jgi:hypothetical protein